MPRNVHDLRPLLKLADLEAMYGFSIGVDYAAQRGLTTFTARCRTCGTYFLLEEIFDVWRAPASALEVAIVRRLRAIDREHAATCLACPPSPAKAARVTLKRRTGYGENFSVTLADLQKAEAERSQARWEREIYGRMYPDRDNLFETSKHVGTEQQQQHARAMEDELAKRIVAKALEQNAHDFAAFQEMQQRNDSVHALALDDRQRTNGSRQWSRRLNELVTASAAAAKERERCAVVLDYDDII